MQYGKPAGSTSVVQWVSRRSTLGAESDVPGHLVIDVVGRQIEMAGDPGGRRVETLQE